MLSGSIRARPRRGRGGLVSAVQADASVQINLVKYGPQNHPKLDWTAKKEPYKMVQTWRKWNNKGEKLFLFSVGARLDSKRTISNWPNSTIFILIDALWAKSIPYRSIFERIRFAVLLARGVFSSYETSCRETDSGSSKNGLGLTTNEFDGNCIQAICSDRFEGLGSLNRKLPSVLQAWQILGRRGTAVSDEKQMQVHPIHAKQTGACSQTSPFMRWVSTGKESKQRLTKN